jgi:hypothetical protein
MSDIDRERRAAAVEAAIQAIKQPLPDGLQALLMELELRPRQRNHDDGVADNEDDFVEVLGYFGRVKWIDWDDASIFRQKAEKGSTRYGITIIASPEVIDRWFKTPSGYTLPIPQRADYVFLKIFDAKVADSLAEPFAIEKWEELYFKDGRGPEDFESAADWLRENQVRDLDLERLQELREISNHRIESMANALDRQHREPPTNSFLVPGLIPDGVPLGEQKSRQEHRTSRTLRCHSTTRS